MRQFAFALVLSLALTGCAMQGPYGNFVEKPESLDNEKIAGDTVRQLAVLYPPAKTRFELQHSAADAFGQVFVQELREKGYALLEFDPRTKKAAGTKSAAIAPVQGVASAFPLSYVLDKAIDTNLYHVTIIVGDQSITRAYAGGDGSFAPAGYWVHKE